MEITTDNILLLGSLLLIASVFISRSALIKLGVPILFIFLVIGVLAGSNGIVNLYFHNIKDAQFLGIMALIFILFSGGLDTNKDDIKPVLGRGLILSFFGVIVTAFIVGSFIYYISDFTLIESMLIASIFSSTDAGAVFGIFRSQNLGVNKKLQSLLELESGSNDPTAFLLTIIILDLLQKPTIDSLEIALMFLQSLSFGLILGVVFGFVIVKIINKINLAIDGLYFVLSLAMSVLVYAATDLVNGNGFLAVYVSAIIMGNSNFVHKRSILRFYDGMAWLSQVTIFIALGLFVNVKDLFPILGISLLIAVFMIFVARPIAIGLCLLPFKIPIKEQALISWVGLRGAVPIVFAMFPLAAGIKHADTIFNIVFLIAATSLLCQGMLIPTVAKKLGLVEKVDGDTEKIDIDKYAHTIGEIAEIFVKKSTASVGKTIMELGLPKQALIVMIQRDGVNITPNGSTILLSGDKLLVVAENRKVITELKNIIGFAATDAKLKNQVLIGGIKRPKYKY